MDLPFTADEFFEVFRAYNEAVWPVQAVLLVLALALCALVPWPRRWADAAIAGGLAFLWAWLALAYHLAFFTRINPLAYVFAGASLAGALVFLWQGVVRRRLQFAWQAGVRSWMGTALVAFALIVYPAWSVYAGHAYPHMPTFGLPCPTTLFTVGLLAFLRPPFPRSPLVVPVLWSFVGALAAVLLGVSQDAALVVAGAVGLVLLARAKTPRSGHRRLAAASFDR